ncbi:MAG: hypothetical protein ACTSVU_01900 [Promethearchaeota archaeon]
MKHRSKKTRDKPSQAPLKVSKADFHRAYQNVKKFDNLVARGKTPKEMVNDMIRMIETDHDQANSYDEVIEELIEQELNLPNSLFGFMKGKIKSFKREDREFHEL